MTEAEFLAALPALAFQAVLVLARFGAAAMVLPGIGEQEVPTTIRLGLALALVAVLLPVVAPGLPPSPATIGETLRLLLVETAVGLWIGGLARAATFALIMAGQATAAMLGLASVLVPDPQLGASGTALGRLFGLAGVVLMLASGLYALPLRALAESYAVLPAGGAFPAGDAAEALALAAAGSLALALRLAAPFVLGAVVFNLALGLLSRLAPQVQVYFVAIPGQILAGLALLALLLPTMLALWTETAAEGFAALPGLR